MKKILLLFFVIAAFMLTSCRKTHVCYCTEISSGQKVQVGAYKPRLLSPINNIVENRDLKKSCENHNANGVYTNCEVVKE